MFVNGAFYEHSQRGLFCIVIGQDSESSLEFSIGVSTKLLGAENRCPTKKTTFPITCYF